MTKRPSVAPPKFDIVGGEPPPAPAPAPAAETKKGFKERGFRTSIWFPHELHDVLREIAFAERKTVTDLLMEGLDAALTKRGYQTTAKLGRAPK